MNRFPFILLIVPLLGMTSCWSGALASRESGGEELGDHSISRSHILSARDLESESGTILDVMDRKFVAFQVDRRFNCPAISLRGAPNTVPGITEPLVFVNHTRAIDTCILEMLSASDVARVEIYPRGFTNRPGYDNSPHGLILLFMRDR